MDPIDYFFRPKSIAVVGASRNPKKFGHIIFRNLLSSGKNVYPVNPNAAEVLGKETSPIVKGTDLAVIAVPEKNVYDAVKDCASAGVKASVIITAGFAEAGNKAGEENIRYLRGAMRIIGPNVIGIYDAYSGIDTVFNLRHRQQRPRPGSVSFISQSGAFGTAVLDAAAEEGVGISKFVSLGNMLDVSETDMIRYLTQDKSTGVICVYLEGSKDYRNLYSSLREASKKKPVIVVKAGKTEATKKAVASHTASLAGTAAVFSGMLRQAGCLEARGSEEMFDVAKAFVQPLPHNNRVHIVTDGGGFGILAADSLVGAGMRLSKLSPAAAKSIAKVVPSYATISNPVDLTGDADTKRYADVLPLVLEDRGVDAVIVIALMQISSLDSKIISVLASMKRFQKPVLVCMAGGTFSALHRKMLEENGIPAYPSVERAVNALAGLMHYSSIRRAK